MMTPTLQRDLLTPSLRAVELAQRGRMILDVATVDLEAAEEALGPFHPTSWHFRQALAEARKSWDRLRAEFGGATLEAAMIQPPVAVLTIGPERSDHSGVVLIPIGGQTYRAQQVQGTPLAPIQWRLTRLAPPLENGPYYACRLRDGSIQCDCAEWNFREDSPNRPEPCKHLGALQSLGWL